MVSLQNIRQERRRTPMSARHIIRRLMICGVMVSTLSVVKLAVAEAGSDNKGLNKQSQNQYLYQASFFKQYLPQNALEMVQRLPGFNFDQGQNNRGFGGNAGNVLIDGARPISKSGGLRSALVRIPAAQVDYIEILRGGIGASETSGQSVVANVVRKQKGSSGTWAGRLRRSSDGRIRPNIEAAINTTLGEWKAASDIDTGAFPTNRTALIEDRDADRLLTSSTDEVFAETRKWVFINGEAATKLANGLLTLNARFASRQRKSTTDRNIFALQLPGNNDPGQLLEIDQQRKSQAGEFGVDWVNTSDGWKFHTIGIGLVEEVQFRSQRNFEDFLDADISSSLFSQGSLRAELITRSTYGFVGQDPFKPEYGIELAQNRLKSDATLVNDGNNSRLNGADVVVEELRSEIFATFTYQASSKLSLEGGLIGELSQITVSGDASNKQTFKFIKPRLSATYKFSSEHQLSVVAQRKVGQLSFGDFAASNNAADDNTFSGNPNLAPDVSDNVSATYDWSFNDRGSLTVRLFHQWKQDILEQVILPSGGQGLGNAGNARLWGVETSLNLPLDWILDDGLLEINHGYQDVSFLDPLTGDKRVINNFSPNSLNIQFRQDLINSQSAWGISYFSRFLSTRFNVNERLTFEGNDRTTVFIETSRFFGVKTQLEIRNLNTFEPTRSRFIHVGDRSNPLERSEIAFRRRKPEIKFSISGTF